MTDPFPLCSWNGRWTFWTLTPVWNSNFYYTTSEICKWKALNFTNPLPSSWLFPFFFSFSVQDPPSERGSPSCVSTTKFLPSRRDVPDSPASLASSRSPTPLKTKELNLVSRAVEWINKLKSRYGLFFRAIAGTGEKPNSDSVKNAAYRYFTLRPCLPSQTYLTNIPGVWQTPRQNSEH